MTIVPMIDTESLRHESASRPSAGLADDVLHVDRLQAQVDALCALMSFGWYSTAADGTVLSINDQALAWLGRRREDIVGKAMPPDWLTPVSRDKLQAKITEAGDSSFDDVNIDLVSRDGFIRHVALSSRLIGGSGDEPASRRSVLIDVTEMLRSSEHQKIAAIAFESLAGICVMDGEGNVLQINKAFTTLTGYNSEDVKGNVLNFISSTGRDQPTYDVIRLSLKSRGSWEGEIRELRKDGRPFIGWLSISSIRQDEDTTSYYVCSFYDITENRTSQAETSRLASLDSLTQLPNRRNLQERLSSLLALGARPEHHGALLFIDLDNFKSLNDTRGHPAGDLLLIEVGRRLLHAVRQEDTVARMGGDEFVILLKDLGPSDTSAAYNANIVGRKILVELAEPYQIDEFDFICTASMGICIFVGGEKAADLLQQADLAMYQVKGAGKNNLCFFNPAMQAVVTARVRVEQDLVHALQDHQFELYYQPQVSLDGTILAAEALLRWQHPQRGLVMPGEFIPLAEELGTILPIGSWVLEKACAQIKAWEAEPSARHLRLAVNVSALQFRQPNFVSHLLKVIRDSGANLDRLMIELTESMTQDIFDIRAKIEMLRKAGVIFSLDDFGTGYSSLLVLTKLPLQQLKIAQTFVTDVLTDPSDAMIVRTAISMSQNLGLEVVAEGVETNAQRDFLVSKGCSIFQGYLFSEPVPLHEFEALLEKQLG